jgi:hypothetical protein
MLALFLFLLLVAIVLGLIGTVVEGLFFLLIVGVAVFVVDLLMAATLWMRRSHRRTVR